MGMTAYYYIYAEFGTELNIMPLLVVNLVAVFCSPMREENNHIGIFTSRFNIADNLIFIKHINAPRLIIGQCNAVCSVSIIKKCKLYSVYLLILNSIILLLTAVNADIGNLGMIGEELQFL